MGKIAFVFPGQGAQAIGMGKDVYDQVPEAREIFDVANRVLDYSLTDIIFNGPEDQLKQTANTQPALLTTSYALYKAFEKKGIKRRGAVGDPARGEVTVKFLRPLKYRIRYESQLTSAWATFT
ncbi:MAG: ACP S-malonyltransferase, partial [Paenibacillus sp.]|nr:ACP S-malonyltransferase [Paenibacillus sp.]